MSSVWFIPIAFDAAILLGIVAKWADNDTKHDNPRVLTMRGTRRDPYWR